MEIRPVAEEISRHRLSFLRRLGTETETAPRASFDGEILRLPSRLAVFPSRDANAALYIWLTALAANAPDTVVETDPFRADLRLLSAAGKMVRQTLEGAPGLGELYTALSQGSLLLRPPRRCPPGRPRWSGWSGMCWERQKSCPPKIRLFLERIETGTFERTSPHRAGIASFRPVPVWPDLREVVFSAGDMVENRETDGPRKKPVTRRCAPAGVRPIRPNARTA